MIFNKFEPDKKNGRSNHCVNVITLVSNKVLIIWRIWAGSMIILWRASILKALWKQIATNMFVSYPLPLYRILTIQDFFNDWDFAPVSMIDNEDYLYFLFSACATPNKISEMVHLRVVHSITEFSSNHKQVKIPFEFLAWTLKINCAGH